MPRSSFPQCLQTSPNRNSLIHTKDDQSLAFSDSWTKTAEVTERTKNTKAPGHVVPGPQSRGPGTASPVTYSVGWLQGSLEGGGLPRPWASNWSQPTLSECSDS